MSKFHAGMKDWIKATLLIFCCLILPAAVVGAYVFLLQHYLPATFAVTVIVVGGGMYGAGYARGFDQASKNVGLLPSYVKRMTNGYRPTE